MSWFVPEKSLHKSDPGKRVKLHIFKMATMTPLMYYWLLWLILYPVNVLATDRKMGFLNRMNIFSSAYDERWRNYNIYEVIVTSQTGNLIVGLDKFSKLSHAFNVIIRCLVLSLFSREDLSRQLEFDYVRGLISSVECRLDIRCGLYCLGI